MSRTIQLSKGKSALVDNDDYDSLSKYKWHFNVKDGKEHGYAQRSKHVKLGYKKYSSKIVYMHREIMNSECEIDHINGNTLDNRRENLRESNRLQQARNSASRKGSSSKYLGVHTHKLTGKWRAQIKVEGKTKSLGLFISQEEAFQARTEYIEKNQLKWFRE